MDKKMFDVFISFSFSDQPVVENIARILLEKYNITYWICTEEIRAGDNYKEDIVGAIESSRLVLFVQSRNSVSSEEVPKEIAKALKEKKPVIPFLIDEADLEGALEYDLLSVHRIDATRPTMEERVEELARQIYAILKKKPEDSDNAWVKRFNKIRLISTPAVNPKTVFFGREDVVAEIYKRFSEGERVQFLHGIGGIGKTQIAKQYAKRYKNNYDTVIFATYNESLRDMVLGDSPFTLEPEMPRYIMPDNTQETDHQYFARKLDKIKKITDERTLIVIDNFDVEEDEDLQAFADAKYHLLVTTRCDYSRYYPTIKIGAIDSIEDLKTIFFANYDGYDVEEDDPALVDLIEMVNRHTYTVELLAQQMENSGETPTEMIRALKKEGIMSLNEEIRGEDMKKRAAYENLTKMFKLFTLTEEEKKVLMYLSFMPIEGVNVRFFRECAGLDSTKLIKSLEMKSWIVKNTEGIALHPIIREVIMHEITATEENCADFLSKFTEAIEDNKTWQMERSEKCRYAAITRAVIERFSQINVYTERMYYFAEALFSYAVDPKGAIELAKRLLDYNIRENGRETFETAHMMFKLGWAYSFNSQLEDSYENAAHWLGKADEIFKKIKLKTSDEISRQVMAKTNLAKIHLAMYINGNKEEDYKKAKAYGEESISNSEMAFRPGEFHYSKVAGARMQHAEVLCVGGEYQKALELADEAEKILLSMFSDDAIDMMFAYFGKAKALYGLGDFKQAKHFAKKSVEGYEVYVGENHPKLYEFCCLLGDCSLMLGETDEAISVYEKAFRIAENIYEPGAKRISDVAEKLKKLRV